MLYWYITGSADKEDWSFLDSCSISLKNRNYTRQIPCDFSLYMTDKHVGKNNSRFFFNYVKTGTGYSPTCSSSFMPFGSFFLCL